MRNIVERITDWYRKLPEKKKYVEFITAVLSVPVMLTVIIINLNNLKQQKSATEKQMAEAKTTPIQVVITGEKQTDMKMVPTATSSLTVSPSAATSPTAASCVKDVGTVSIAYPRESEVVTNDPVCMTLTTQAGHCDVVWSYRLDGGSWSDYGSSDICFHNLKNGNRTVQLKIKSTASNDEVTLQRIFIYQGNSDPTATPTPASSSATLP